MAGTKKCLCNRLRSLRPPDADFPEECRGKGYIWVEVCCDCGSVKHTHREPRKKKAPIQYAES